MWGQVGRSPGKKNSEMAEEAFGKKETGRPEASAEM